MGREKRTREPRGLHGSGLGAGRLGVARDTAGSVVPGVLGVSTRRGRDRERVRSAGRRASGSWRGRGTLGERGRLAAESTGRGAIDGSAVGFWARSVGAELARRGLQELLAGATGEGGAVHRLWKSRAEAAAGRPLAGRGSSPAAVGWREEREAGSGTKLEWKP